MVPHAPPPTLTVGHHFLVAVQEGKVTNTRLGRPDGWSLVGDANVEDGPFNLGDIAVFRRVEAVKPLVKLDPCA